MVWKRERARLLSRAKELGATPVLLDICASGPAMSSCSDDDDDAWDHVARIALAQLDSLKGLSSLGAVAAKLALNAISTGSFIAKGCVFGNRMVNLNISNVKLLHRALDTVETLSGATRERAREALLRAIYGDEAGAKAAAVAPTPEADRSHVESAQPLAGVVPVALLVAWQGTTAWEARERLARDPRVRHQLLAGLV